MASTTTKCRRCGMSFAWENNYSRDSTAWSEHSDPLDCIAVLRHELNDTRLREIIHQVQQLEYAKRDFDERIASLECK